MAKRDARREPFAEMVEAVPDSGLLGQTEFSALGQKRQFEDEQGTTWTRRGDHALEGKSLGKRLLDDRVLVWHEYGLDVTVIPPGDREQFWQQAQVRMRESAYSEYSGREFKDAGGQVLLIVHEDC